MADELLTIGEVAARTGLSTSALRFYEREGLLRSERTSGGQRRYPREVLRRVAFVRVAQSIGLDLEQIAELLGSLPRGRTPTKADWARLSRGWRPMLDERIATLERLRDQLSDCIGCGCLSLRACALYNPSDRAAGFGAGPRYLLGDRPGDVVMRGELESNSCLDRESCLILIGCPHSCPESGWWTTSTRCRHSPIR